MAKIEKLLQSRAQSSKTRYPEEKVTTQVGPLTISDEELMRLARNFGTPTFVIDESVLKSKLQGLKTAFANYRDATAIAYSMKANFNPAVLKTFIAMGTLFDVTSVQELFFYLQSGGHPSNVIYTSITEEVDEYAEVLQSGVGRVVVSSNNGLSNLIRAAENMRTIPQVLLRINPEVGVKADIRASYRNGKFGVPLTSGDGDTAGNLMRQLVTSDLLMFEGFHFHLGSQITDPSSFLHALEKLESFILRTKREYPDLRIGTIDIGGGTPVNYGVRVPTPAEIGQTVGNKLNSLMRNTGEHSLLIVESGRYLSAEAGLLLSKIVNTKINGDHKTIFVDAGYHILLDSALLRQEYPQYVVPTSLTSERLKINLTGRLCDTFDVFQISPASDLSGAEVGNYVVFRNSGAYSLVFNMPFHCQTKPPVVLRKDNGEYQLIRKRGTIEDLFEAEGGFLP